MEEKPESAKLKFRKPEIVSLRKSKSTKHKTLEEPEVEEKEELTFERPTLTIHKGR